MMNFKLKVRAKAAEREFVKFQRPAFQPFFIFVVFLLFMATLVTILEVETFLQPITSLLIAIPMAIGIAWASRCKTFKFLEYFVMSLCLGIYGVYFFNRYELVTSPGDFSFGYILAFFERMTIERLPMFKHKALFAISAAIIRSVMMRSILVQDILFVVLLLVCELLLDKTKQRKETELFNLYYNFKEINNNFGELFKVSISESMFVLKSNLLECLFFNDAFHQNFQIKKESIKEFLQRFRLVKTDLLRSQTGVRDIEIKIDSANTSKEVSRNIERSGSNITQKEDTVSGKTLYNQLESLSSIKEFMEDPLDYLCVYSAPDSEADVKRLSIKIVPFSWQEQSSFAIIINDVTDQHQLTDFKQLNEGKDKTIAAVSHELRTPLNGILGMIQIMEKEITQSHLAKYLKTCKTSAKLLLSLVNSILDMAQSKENKLRLNPNNYRLTDILEEVVSLFDFQCQAKGLYLQTIIEHDVPKVLYTDKNRLIQILINLIGNALKFTFKGGITLCVDAETNSTDTIRFSVKDTGVGIKDQDKDNLFKVFGKLEDTATINPNGVGLGLNISNTLAFLLNENEEESGIKVESELEKGSTFYFIVKKKLNVEPKSELEKHSEKIEEYKRRKIKSRTQKELHKLVVNTRVSQLFDSREKEENEASIDQTDEFIELTERVNRYCTVTNSSRVSLETPRALKEFNFNTQRENSTSNIEISSPRTRLLSNGRKSRFTHRENSQQVLVIDDNAFNLMVAKELIEAQGVPAQISPDSKMAIEHVIQRDKEKQPYKLILMDCEMPGMDGYQATQALKEKMLRGEIEDVPVIALTANDIETVRAQCLKSGMLDCLAKPISEEDIKITLAKYIAEQRSQFQG